MRTDTGVDRHDEADSRCSQFCESPQNTLLRATVKLRKTEIICQILYNNNNNNIIME
jgi:hypothetical protein